MKTNPKSPKHEEKPSTRVFSVGTIAPDDRPFAALNHLREPESPPGIELNHHDLPASGNNSNLHGKNHRINLSGQLAIIMRSSKGHAGKTVTLISNLKLDHSEAHRLLHLLKSRLGIGGSLEAVENEPVLLLQGDVRDRTITELSKLNAKVKRAGG